MPCQDSPAAGPATARSGRLRQALWFAGLWLAGVLSLGLLATLMRCAMRFVR